MAAEPGAARAAFSVAVEPALRALLTPILTHKCLKDDATWATTLAPGLLRHVTDIETLLRDQPARPHDTALAQDCLRQLRASLTTRFAEQAPFTVRRVAEIVTCPAESGYTLSRPSHVAKYLEALARVLSVASSETQTERLRLEAKQAVGEESESGKRHGAYGLPNVKYVALEGPGLDQDLTECIEEAAQDLASAEAIGQETSAEVVNQETSAEALSQEVPLSERTLPREGNGAEEQAPKRHRGEKTEANGMEAAEETMPLDEEHLIDTSAGTETGDEGELTNGVLPGEPASAEIEEVS